MIRVIFDARSVVSQASGIGNYAASLLRNMVRLDDGFIFTVLRHPQCTEPLVRSDRVREVALIPGETKSVATLLRSGRVMRLSGHDLYHSPADMVPLRLPCPFVVTMHDMMWVEAPHLAARFPPSRIAMHVWYRSHFSHSIRRAQRVIAISQATADAIARIYPSSASKVRVVRHGLDMGRFSRSRVPQRSVLDDWVPRECRFALAVGQGSPYKNHANIVRAYLHATTDMPEHRLVLARRFSRWDSEMRRLLARPDVRQRVLVYPYVPDTILMALYGHAEMLVFASRYEGCGMPAMEAMALGTPVIASKAPALMEVTGGAALHAESTDVYDISVKIRSLLDDDVLRKRLSEAGKQHVLSFSWERCAQETLNVYRESVPSRSRCCCRSAWVRHERSPSDGLVPVDCDAGRRCTTHCVGG